MNITSSRAACVVVVLLVGASVQGAPKGDEIILLGGGTTTDAARAVAERYTAARLDGLITPAPGFPKILSSASIQGLKPGFEVAVLGVCPEGERAANLRDVVNLVAPGAYLRTVTGDFEGQCPELKGAPSVPRGMKLVESMPVVRGSKVQWRVHAREPATFPKSSGTVPWLVLQLAAGKDVLTEATVSGSQRQSSGPGDLGESSRWSWGGVVSLASRQWLLVDESSWVADTEGLRQAVYGLVCGQLRELYVSRLRMGGPAPTLSAEGDALVIDEGGPATYRVDEAGCQLLQARASDAGVSEVLDELTLAGICRKQHLPPDEATRLAERVIRSIEVSGQVDMVGLKEREALKCLGAAGTTAVGAFAARRLASPDPSKRREGVAFLTQVSGVARAESAALVTIAQSDTDAALRADAAWALCLQGEPRPKGAALVMARAIESRERAARLAECVGSCPAPVEDAVLTALLERLDVAPVDIAAALAALKRPTVAVAQPLINRALHAPELFDVARPAGLLCKHGPEAVAKGQEAFLAATASAEEGMRLRGLVALSFPCFIEGKGGEALVHALDDSSAKVRAELVQVVAGIARQRLDANKPQPAAFHSAIAGLRKVVSSRKEAVEDRCRAAEALGVLTADIPAQDRAAVEKEINSIPRACVGDPGLTLRRVRSGVAR